METPLLLNGQPLTIADVVAVARNARRVKLGDDARNRMLAARSAVERALTDGQPHYGINTGFGSLARKRVGADQLRDLQRNLVRSHAAGVGELLSEEIVRGVMLLLAASLSRGLSGARPVVADLLIDLLNAGITPMVPSLGSVGASGDLAPLAHVGLVLMGEGGAFFGGRKMHGGEALDVAKLTAIELEAKEGLAIINGTHLMAAQGALACHDAEELIDQAVIAAAMSMDAARGTDAFLDARIHEARRQPGQMHIAGRLREALAGSTILTSHVENDPRVQDPYSLRCTPQVLGAAWDALSYVKQCVANELGAVTDNPLVFTTGDDFEVISAGNFHGMPLAIPLDTLAVAITHIAGISERRIFWLLSAFDAESHLKPYLAVDPGVNSGLMIAQYTAAACCNEAIGLCNAASVANVVTSAGQEDYNSFGPRSAAKARRVIDLTRHVVAIEFLCAAEGIEQHRPLKSGGPIETAHARIRAEVPRLTDDRSPAGDIAALERMLRRHELRGE